MTKQKLRFIVKLRGLSGAQLAKLCGVSRQAVSLWFKNGDKSEKVGLRAQTLVDLSASLGISLDRLVEEIPHLDSPGELKELDATFNWDKLFPSIEDFMVALLQCQPRAVARLVQTVGLFASAAMLGKRIWHDFDKYKRYMHPKRREQCQQIWKTQKNLGLI